MGLFSKKNKSISYYSSSPQSAKNKEVSGFLCDNMSFAAKEAYKRFRTNIVFSFADEGTCRIVGITSSQPSEGKTLTSINLSYSLTELGKSVLLIDGDMRRSSIHSKLDLKLTPGLSNLMVTTSDVNGTIQSYACKSGIEFDIISAGDCPPNPSELLNSERMKQLLNTLRSRYDYIIIDLPPICVVVDALSISSNVDGMVILLRENFTTKRSVAYCVEQLRFTGVKILGFVVNGSLEGAGKKYSYLKYKGYYGYRGNYGQGYYYYK